MREKIYKAGRQSSADPFEFVMSTDRVDRHGDIVEQDWNLREFKKNPIALWGHKSDVPIGVWENVRVRAGALMGRLKLAEKGTSEFIDTLHSLVEQRVLKAVSVGFMPGDATPLNEKKPWEGLRLTKNELMETSLVSVGANPEALSLMKSLDADPALREKLVSATEDLLSDLSAAKQLGLTKAPRASGKSTRKPTSIKRNTTMSLAQRIEAAHEQLIETKQALTDLTEIDETELDEEETEQHELQLSELTDKVNKQHRGLGKLMAAEKAIVDTAIAKRASAKDDLDVGDSLQTRGPGRNIRSKKVREKGHVALATMAYMFKGYCQRVDPAALVENEKPEDKDELSIMLKAATSPADVPTDAWAGNLVRDSWGEFIELLRDTSVYPQLPGYRLEFDRNGTIKLPRNDGRGALAGGFVGEGVPIPVKEGVIGSVDLTPKKMAVISTYTREIGRYSTPAVQGIINTQILGDTGEALDGVLLGSAARDTVTPAGYQDTTETGAGNIATASGATVAAIIADTQAMMAGLMAARVSTSAVWIMNPINLLYLRNVQDAASGSFPFRAEIAAGTFMGSPVVSSQNVPVDVVYLQGNGAVAYGNSFAPMIEVSDQTTVVFDDTAPDHIVDSGTVTTQPVKSMFQMDAVAVKMTLGLDWRIVRVGGIQVLNTVDWS